MNYLIVYPVFLWTIENYKNEANLRDLIAATGLVFLLKIEFQSLIFGPMWPGTLMEGLKNDRAPPLYHVKLCASFQSHWWIQTRVRVQKHSIWVKIGDFFVLCDLEIWQMTLENNRAPLLCYFKLCASFHSHLWIQNGVTVRKRSIRVKIGDFLPCVTLKFEGWPWKTIGHLFYATSSFVHHFIAIREFKLELQSGNS